jgi:mRNA interferase MazF
MTSYNAGDVALVEFVFSDESGVKKRPALVISSPKYHQSRQEVIVAAITSNVSRSYFGDTPVSDWKKAGLLLPSAVTAIIRTIKDSMLAKKLGALSPRDFSLVVGNLKSSLALNF